MLNVIDVSVYQPDIDYAAVKAAGIDGAVIQNLKRITPALPGRGSRSAHTTTARRTAWTLPRKRQDSCSRF